MSTNYSHQDGHGKVCLQSQISSIHPVIVILGILLACIAALLFKSDMKLAAMIPVGIIAVAMSLFYPVFAIAICLSTLLFDQIFNPEMGEANAFFSPMRLFQVFAFVVQFPLVITRKRHKLVVATAVWLLLLYAMWALFTIGWSPDPKGGFLDWIKFVIQLMFFYVAVSTVRSLDDVRKILFINVVLTALACYYIMFFAGDMVRNMDDENRRLAFEGIRSTSLAGTIGMAILCLVAYCVCHKKITWNVLLIVATLPIMFAITLKSGTRSVFLGIPLAICLAGILVYWRQLPSQVFRLLILGFCFFTAFLWFVSQGFLGDDLLDRLYSISSADFWEARGSIWMAAFDYYFHSPQGTGLGGEYLATQQVHLGESHNTFLSVLVQTSLIGFLLFIGAFIIIWKKAWRIDISQYRFCALLIYIGIFIQASRSTLIHNRLLWFYIIIICLIIECVQRSKDAGQQSP